MVMLSPNSQTDVNSFDVVCLPLLKLILGSHMQRYTRVMVGMVNRGIIWRNLYKNRVSIPTFKSITNNNTLNDYKIKYKLTFNSLEEPVHN